MSYPTTSFDFRDPMIGEIDPGNHFTFYPTWQPPPIQYDETGFDHHQFSSSSSAWTTNGTGFPQILSNYPQPSQNSQQLQVSLNIIPSSATINNNNNTFEIKTIEPLQQPTLPTTTISFQQQQQQPQPCEIKFPSISHLPLNEPPTIGTKLFSCNRCGKQYCRKSTLKAHLKHHMGERPFICQICGKTFSQAANLTAHRRVHTGEKPFSCTICLRPFSQSSSLVTHKRTHTGERPYPCNHCDKAFTDSSTLTKHLRTHSGQKPYECPLCMMRFSQSGNLHRHLKTHRNGEIDIKP
uniref:C2H2-type domain-containing protein n=1 Tax=Panagrolaimus sp. PS1159 TaxID=55785 RepID=A0AC35F5V0_9BILA